MDTHHTRQQDEPLRIGERVRHEIELRITELQHRRIPSARDLHELSRLQEFLATVAPRDGKAGMQ